MNSRRISFDNLGEPPMVTLGTRGALSVPVPTVPHGLCRCGSGLVAGFVGGIP